ncbi:hypothetical protein CISG_02931 [Coccidioides immitis RMSCC 3703]|uniref:Uncharacterized protein n=1 Tax=Coccidioides immitis RMSCC 3703 TaxID=454286 RepID=A0A0J8TF85_COCIT|nr:hypothetical protein CISG_02931 [Coccidioides immitis RMSCC 3703]
MDSESNNGGPSAERPVLASRASFSMFKLPDREEYLSNLPKSKRAAPEGFDIASIRLIPSSEKKIETIDERLTSIERLLQDLALSIPTSSQAPPNTRQSSDHSRQNDGAKVRSVIQKSEATTPSAHFEGESALSAHSVLQVLFSNRRWEVVRI